MAKVKEFMHSVVFVGLDDTVQRTAQAMDRRGLGCALVNCGEDLCGIITEKDILSKVVAKGKDPKKLRASDIMSTPLYTIDQDADVREAFRIFKEKNIRRLPVTKEGKIVGIITLKDTTRALPFLLAKGMRGTKGLNEMRYWFF